MFFMIANKGTSSVVCITYYYYTTRTFINTLVVPLFTFIGECGLCLCSGILLQVRTFGLNKRG